VKFNVYLLNNDLEIKFFSQQPDTEAFKMNFLHKVFKADPCSVTEHSSCLSFWVCFIVLPFECLSVLVTGPTDDAQILRSLTETGTEEEKFRDGFTSLRH